MQTPETIIIEPVRGCNIACSFCHVRFTNHQMMKPDTLSKIYLDIKGLQTIPRVVLSGRGEPSLHPALLTMAMILKEIPGIHITLETNGVKRLPHNIRDVVDDIKKLKGRPEFIQGFSPPSPPLREQCLLPSTEMVVLYNGDVSLCRYDWQGEALVGNIHQSNLSSIWTHSERLNWMRRFLANRIRCPFPWCSKCDVRGKRQSDHNYDRLFQDDIEAMRRSWNLGGLDGRSN